MPPPPRQRASATDGPTLAEIGRVLEALRADTENRLDRIEAKFDNLDSKYVRLDLYQAETRARDAQLEGYRGRIASLEDGNQWLVRLIIGAVITAVLSGLFAASQVLGSG